MFTSEFDDRKKQGFLLNQLLRVEDPRSVECLGESISQWKALDKMSKWMPGPNALYVPMSPYEIDPTSPYKVYSTHPIDNHSLLFLFKSSWDIRGRISNRIKILQAWINKFSSLIVSWIQEIFSNPKNTILLLLFQELFHP